MKRIALLVICSAALTFVGCDAFMAGFEEGRAERKAKVEGMEKAEESSMLDSVIPSFANEAEARTAKKGADMYKLVDPQTMEQVLQYRPPAGWMTGGKSVWVPSNPTVPNTFYFYAVSPDASMKFIMSSNFQMGGQGRIDQNPMLNPSTLAEKVFIPAAQRDYNLSDIQVVSAEFEQAPDGQQRQQQHIQQGMAQGFRFSDIRCVNYRLRLKGTREGKSFFVTYAAPTDIIEMQPGMGFVHSAEMLTVVSFGGPEGTEAKVEKISADALATLELNQRFMQIRQETAQTLTNQSIAEANRKWDIIRQRHIQNMRESDERLNSFLEKSNRDHQRVMGGGGSGGSGSMLDKWDEYIKDVDRVDNPNGGEMYIDNRYDHAWINSDNEVMYMDSGSFNPNENAAFNNREWKRVR